MGHNDHIDYELHDAIDDLVAEGKLEVGTPAYGVAQQAVSLGYDSLSPEQKALYDGVVVPALERRAKRLGDFGV